MAIHWCDPYLNTSTGGIHGTTTSGQSSGDGSYASPWSLTELNNQTNYSGWSDGDELRFKGLVEDAFFPPANSSTFKQSNQTTDYSLRTDYNGYYQPSLYFTSGDDHKLVKLKQQDRGAVTGKTFYYKHHNTSSDRIRTIVNDGTWYPNLCPIDVSNGYIPLDDRYQITVNINGGSTGEILRYITARIIITAGWTSETQQNGITVLDANSTSVFGSTCYWGTQTNHATYPAPIWDCLDTLIMSRYRSSGTWYVFGAVVKFKAIADAGQNYSVWTMHSGANANANTANMPAGYNMGDISIDSLVAVNSQFNLYGAQNSPHLTEPTLDISFWCDYGASQDRIYPYMDNIKYKLKEYYGYSCFAFGLSYAPIIELADGWNLEVADNSPAGFLFNSSLSAERRSNIANNALIGTRGDSYLTLSGGTWSFTKEASMYLYYIFQYNVVEGIKGTNTNDKIFCSTGLFEQIQYTSLFQNSGFIESLDTKGVALEDTTISPIEFTLSNVYPWQLRLNVRQEPGKMLPVTMLQPTSTGYAAMLYNSPNFNYKKAVRFFTQTNGKTYVDVVAYDMPTFSSNVTFNAEYTTTSTPGVTLNNKLYLYDTSTERFVQVANVSGSVNGTTITCNTTLSSSTLTNKAGLLIVAHEFTKTSADTSEVAYNSVTVT